MTIDIGETVFSGTGRFCRMGMAVALLAIGGCSSTTNGDAGRATGIDGPKDTGTFPNLNIPPKVAAQQFTDAEKNAKLAQLQADQRAQAGKGGGAVKPANAAALAALAKNHGNATLKQIEGKCDPTLDPTCK